MQSGGFCKGSLDFIQATGHNRSVSRWHDQGVAVDRRQQLAGHAAEEEARNAFTGVSAQDQEVRAGVAQGLANHPFR